MKYIYILEGKIGRLEVGKATEDVEGLCTHEFTSCNILVLISQDLKRYVLIHADLSLNAERVMEEIGWVGKDAYKLLYRRVDGYGKQQLSTTITDKVLRNIKSSFQEILVDTTTEVISIKIGQKEAVQSTKLPESVEYHPKSSFLITQHVIEAGFSIEKQSPFNLVKKHAFANSLMYDNGWTVYQNFAISEHAFDELVSYGLGKKDAPAVVLSKIIVKRPNSDYRMAIHDAANIYCYFYLFNQTDDLPETFLNEAAERLFVLTTEKPKLLNRDSYVNNFIKKYGNAKKLEDLVSLSESLHAQSGIEKQTKEVFIMQLDVVVNSYQILFVKYCKSVSVTATETVTTQIMKVNSPVSEAGNAHDKLVAQIIPIIRAHINSFRTFFDAIQERAYAKALRIACASSGREAFALIKYLLKYINALQFDINEQAGEDQLAAIHYVAKCGNVEVYKFLVDRGANPKLQDKNGKTAEDYYMEVKPQKMEVSVGLK